MYLFHTFVYEKTGHVYDMRLDVGMHIVVIVHGNKNEKLYKRLSYLVLVENGRNQTSLVLIKLMHC